MSALASVVSMDFDQAASYALQRLKSPEITLKPEQVEAIRHVYVGKDVSVPPYRVWQKYLLRSPTFYVLST